MLKLTIPSQEYYDSDSEEFKRINEQTIVLEHSLVSISKWESKWKRPFLEDGPKTLEELVYYVQCMTITQHVDPSIYYFLTNENVDAIKEYINDTMTATWFSKDQQGRRGHNREIITSELIYYWMVALQIPFECQKWHLNRLLTLIQVCNLKNQPDKKMSKKDVRAQYRALNAARKAKHHTRG